MKPIAAKTLKVIQYFKDHPDVPVAKVLAKFNLTRNAAYRMRRRAIDESITAGINVDLNKLVFERARPVVDKLNAADRVSSFPDESTDVDQVLDSRAVDYGAFKDGAALMQGIKRLLADHAQKHGKTFADDQWEALEMIVHKMGRIVNGNPDKVDHWTDIAGYAKLVADRLEGRVR